MTGPAWNPPDPVTRDDATFFRDLAETIREPLFVTELPSRAVVYVNPAFVRFLGVTLEQLNSEVGFWKRLVHPDDVEPIAEFSNEMGRAVRAPPYRILGRDGAYHWVSLRYFPRKDTSGAVIGAVGLLEDITETYEQQDRIERLNETLRRVVEVLPVGILAYRQQKPIFANSKLAEQLATPVETLLDMAVPTIINTYFREDERSGGQARWQAAQSGADLPPLERHLTTPDGAQRVAELQTITVDLDGAPANVTVVRDLTEQRRLEGQVAQADRMAALGRISAGIAHELNNPLSYVLGNLELAREAIPALVDECQKLHGRLQQDPELGRRLARMTEQIQELHAAVRDAAEGADRVRAIMRDLKSFSRPDTDDRRESVDVNRPLDAAVRMAWREIQPRARLVQSRGEVPVVLGVEGRLCQVFLNLLVNAAEALPDGESHAHEVRLATLTSAEGEAVIEVTDTGPGIPPGQLPHLFEPFYTTKGPGRGTGLGLSICHDIVHAHGGRIEVASTPGHGATFRVILPPARPQAAGTAVPGPQQAASPRRGQLLIVDDEPHIGATLRQLLGRDHDVTVLTGAAEALARIEGGLRFDVIFCDVMMPAMSGVDLHKALMSVARDQSDRIVFMTGGAFSPIAREFLSQVPNQRLEKPFVLREVRAAVAKLLQ